MESKIEQLLKYTNISEDKLAGTMVLSLKDHTVVQSEKIDEPLDKASMCLSLLSASTSLAQSFNDNPLIRLIRIRTDTHEYFVVHDDMYLLLAAVNVQKK